MKPMKIALAVLIPILAISALLLFTPEGGSSKTVRVSVAGMTCVGCARTIENAVAALPGVEKTDVNVREGYADVVLASASVSVDDIVGAIAGAGYEAEPVQKQGDATPSNPKLDDIRARLAAVKNGLMRDGKYSCCIAPSCDFCAMAANGCPCGDNLAKGKPVCGECKGGWKAGLGTMPDIDPEDVKALPDAELNKLYKKRAELIKSSKPSGDKQ